MLDGDYRQRFPQGALRHEADKARLDALLALGRSDAALDLLERSDESVSADDSQRLVIRGELRAKRGRYGQAVGDFEAALTRHLDQSLLERALFGAASCRVGLGDSPGARTHFQGYLTRFPDGRFAERARRALAAIP